MARSEPPSDAPANDLCVRRERRARRLAASREHLAQELTGCKPAGDRMMDSFSRRGVDELTGLPRDERALLAESGRPRGRGTSPR